MDLKIQQFVAILLLALACNQVAFAQSAESERLMLNADTPVVEIGQQPAGRNFMRLPALAYQFDLGANCPVGLEAKTIALNIADTRKLLAANDLSSDATTRIKMTIPASQIGPIALDGFCVVQDAQETVRIPAVLSVQASLSCANEESRQMIYASISLDVTLSCKIAENEASSR